MNDPEKIDPVQENLITPQEQEHYTVQISNYYEKTSALLLKAFTAIKEKQKGNNYLMETKGEVPQKNLELLEKMTKAFEKLESNIKSLSELLSKELPQLPTSQQEEGKNFLLKPFSQFSTLKKDTQKEDVSLVKFEQSSEDKINDSPFDEEDTRSFYQDLPDLIAQLPSGLVRKKKLPEPSTAEDPNQNNAPQSESTELETEGKSKEKKRMSPYQKRNTRFKKSKRQIQPKKRKTKKKAKKAAQQTLLQHSC